jgi:SH3-like domain-containing protein
MIRLCLLMVLGVLLLGNAARAEDDAEAPGLPVPRFVSLRSGEVNMRVGPGTRYSINWVYKREGLPVEIVQEFDQWRKIRDMDGTTGWVHKQMLQGRRSAIIKARVAVLRRSPDAKASAVIKAEKGVYGRLSECKKEWCLVQLQGKKAWARKADIWGIFAAEEF